MFAERLHSPASRWAGWTQNAPPCRATLPPAASSAMSKGARRNEPQNTTEHQCFALLSLQNDTLEATPQATAHLHALAPPVSTLMFLGSLSLWLLTMVMHWFKFLSLVQFLWKILSEGWVENGDSCILKLRDPALKPVSQLHGASRGRVE